MFVYPKSTTFKKSFFVSDLLKSYERLCLEHSIDTSKVEALNRLKTTKWLEARVTSLSEYNTLNNKLKLNFSNKLKGNYLELISILK